MFFSQWSMELVLGSSENKLRGLWLFSRGSRAFCFWQRPCGRCAISGPSSSLQPAAPLPACKNEMVGGSHDLDDVVDLHDHPHCLGRQADGACAHEQRLEDVLREHIANSALQSAKAIIGGNRSGTATSDASSRQSKLACAPHATHLPYVDPCAGIPLLVLLA